METTSVKAGRAAPSLGYRPDIDGLRAVAVLLVIFFHIGAPVFTGGFIGVDVFFVISGFLITGMLARDIDGEGLSVAGFYERRIRRIFPAMFAMLFVVLAAGVILLTPNNLIYLSKTGVVAALSVSNLFFSRHSGYFDIGSDLVPLIHTWSLGVEEQFYLLFPAIFWIGRKKLGLSWAWIVLPALVLSFAFSIWQTAHAPNSAFYMPFSRCWEFLVGSMLALGIAGHLRGRRVIAELASAAGLMLIIVSALIMNRSTVFPGWAAVFPVVGAGLLIYGNSHHPTLVGRALSVPPVLQIGLISYSLYLWHWPMIAFVRLVFGSEIPAAAYVALFLIMFPVAWLSWRYIERPFRRRRNHAKRTPVFAAAALALVVFGGACVVVNKSLGFPGRLSPAALTVANGYSDGNPKQDACDNKSVDDIKSGKVCAIGPADAPVSFVLVGDSFANALSPAVEVAALKAHRQGLVMTHPGCVALAGVDVNPGCAAFLDAAFQWVARHSEVKKVLLISRWTTAANGRRFGAIAWHELFIRDALTKRTGYAENREVFQRGIVRDLQSVGAAKIYIMAYLPEQKTNVPQAAALRIQIGDHSHTGTPTGVVVERQHIVHDVLSRPEISGRATVLNAMDPLCDSNVCRAVEGGKSLYTDDNHLSTFGSMREVPLLTAALQEESPGAVDGLPDFSD